jgi:hypothetical protein
LTVRDAWVNIGDDCFSPKPNTTNIYVKNIYCNGTHGMSMGSIGQYPGVKDYISNAWVEDVVMLNAEVSSFDFVPTTSLVEFFEKPHNPLTDNLLNVGLYKHLLTA